ncbi:glutamate ABC transporter substrate-binding protein [Streptomyces meridianus]|uniref:Glutamate ABC transporter substrate-binding protein n=1 Tax=Streptomyces meridianus TaxID=2938945 RepID=A0ABT0X2S6_9ACTN|nr:glutamate ABC transporter substrate-binding protein [Streptomyces meridianus]MCM2575972.1 glutamate ABC transporter substrate-binding protein [Streptomyces meridianus]
MQTARSRALRGLRGAAVSAALVVCCTSPGPPAAASKPGAGSVRAAAGTAGSPVAASAAAPAQARGRQATCDAPEASLRPSGKSGPAVKRIRKRGMLIAGVDQNSYRWGYRDPATGEFAGFDIDLVRAVAKEVLGDPDKVLYRPVRTNQRIPALLGGKVDLIARTMTINCDRIGHVAFSTVYFVAGQQVLAPKGSPVKGFDDTLRGRTVCTARGSTGATELAEETHDADVRLVADQLDCLVLLQLGRVDAVITDNALAAGQAAQDPTVELVGEPFTREPYGLAMRPGDEDLVRRVNKVLKAYRKGGADSPWSKAYDRWLKDDLRGVTGPPKAKYRDRPRTTPHTGTAER